MLRVSRNIYDNIVGLVSDGRSTTMGLQIAVDHYPKDTLFVGDNKANVGRIAAYHVGWRDGSRIKSFLMVCDNALKQSPRSDFIDRTEHLTGLLRKAATAGDLVVDGPAEVFWPAVKEKAKSKRVSHSRTAERLHYPSFGVFLFGVVSWQGQDPRATLQKLPPFFATSGLLTPAEAQTFAANLDENPLRGLGPGGYASTVTPFVPRQ